MTVLIEAKNLVKQYPGITAVAGTSFKINEGSCFGLLGPNGAGKSTTIEMLEGIVKATSGEIFYRGKPLHKKHFSQVAGIQFQSTALQENLSVLDNLKLFSSFYSNTAELEELIDVCALKDYIHRAARKLSGGQRQRLLLAIALVNDPDIVFLDEPTTGLDPQARRNFWDLVNGIKARNKTVLLTTHYMEEAYALCDEIAIMDHGSIIARGTPAELLSEHFKESILELPVKDMPSQPIRIDYQESGGYAQIASEDVDQSIKDLLDAGVHLKNLNIRQRTLEDLFIKLTGRGIRE